MVYRPQAVVVELVVAGHGDEAAPGRAQGVEDLHRRLHPHLPAGKQRFSGAW